MEKQIEPFGMNIKNFIYANDLSNQFFADEINNRLQEKDIGSRIYTANDIWTYYSRASFPRDKMVWIAVADIIGKSLDDILTKEFKMDELKNEKYLCSKATKTMNKKCKKITTEYTVNQWKMENLNQLTEKEMSFLYKLFSVGQMGQNGQFTSTFDISIRYFGGQNVKATFHWGESDPDIDILEWTWMEYGNAMNEVGEEAFVVKYKLEDEILNKFYSMGLIEEVASLGCNFDDLSGNEYENIHGYVVVDVEFIISKEEIIKIMEFYLNFLKHELANIKSVNK